METLKPCRKCGCDAEIIKCFIKGTANRIHYFIRCPNCRARQVHSFRKVENSVKNWNRRNDE